jgi:hypothetical protein
MAAVRDLVNQYKGFKDANYCVRVTANDGEIGEQFLREFQDRLASRSLISMMLLKFASSYSRPSSISPSII